MIARSGLVVFSERYPDAKRSVDAWWAEAKRAQWCQPADIKAHYRSASILRNDRAVFNICGNNYPLIVKFEYQFWIGFVKFIGTHHEYDQINAEEV